MQAMRITVADVVNLILIRHSKTAMTVRIRIIKIVVSRVHQPQQVLAAPHLQETVGKILMVIIYPWHTRYIVVINTELARTVR